MEKRSFYCPDIRNKRLVLEKHGYIMIATVILAGAVVILLAVCLYIYNMSTVSASQGIKRNLMSATVKSLYETISERIGEVHYLYSVNELDKEKNKCFLLKVLYTTDEWVNTDEWKANNCPSLSNATSETISGVENYPDFTYEFSDGQTAYIKIVSSSTGNTGINKERLLNVSGTSALPYGTQSVKPPPLPYVYKIVFLIKDKSSNSGLKFVGLYSY